MSPCDTVLLQGSDLKEGLIPFKDEKSGRKTHYFVSAALRKDSFFFMLSGIIEI